LIGGQGATRPWPDKRKIVVCRRQGRRLLPQKIEIQLQLTVAERSLDAIVEETRERASLVPVGAVVEAEAGIQRAQAIKGGEGIVRFVIRQAGAAMLCFYMMTIVELLDWAVAGVSSNPRARLALELRICRTTFRPAGVVSRGQRQVGSGQSRWGKVESMYVPLMEFWVLTATDDGWEGRCCCCARSKHFVNRNETRVAS
jgi:hypothetical protein